MTGGEYANLVAGYVSRRFGARGLKVYREIRVGKTIIGKNRWETESLLAAHGVNWNFSADDVEADQRTLTELLGEKD